MPCLRRRPGILDVGASRQQGILLSRLRSFLDADTVSIEVTAATATVFDRHLTHIAGGACRSATAAPVQKSTAGQPTIRYSANMAPVLPGPSCPECQSPGTTLSAIKSSADEDFNYFHCDACHHDWMSTKFIDGKIHDEEELVERVTPYLLTAGRAAPTDAIAQDLTAADRAAENRLLKLEAQTHGLAEAVIAITEPSATLAPAVQAVKDEM